MIKKIIFIIYVTSVISGCSNHKIVEKNKEVYEIINSILADNKLIDAAIIESVLPILAVDTIGDYKLKADSITKEEIWDSEKIKKHFNLSEIVFIKDLVKSQKYNDFEFDSSKTKIRTIRSSILKSIFKLYKTQGAFDFLSKKSKINSFIKISIPLFNQNKNKVIIAYKTFCGPLCGGGGIYIYEKKNSKWIQIERLGEWVNY